MKILFTQDALVNAGAERSHLEILSRFSQDTEVALVYFYPKQELKREYEEAGVRLIFLDIPEAYHFPLAVSRLVRLIRTEKPDLLISCLWRADIITRMASWITGVPLLGTLVNDSYSPMAWKDKKGLKYKVVYWLDRLTAGIPVHWIANAQALADSHVQTLGLKRERISVVYRGRGVIAREARPKQSPADKTASAAEDLSEKAGTIESSLAVTGDVIARTRYSLPRTNVGEDEAIFPLENSFNQETASAADGPVIKSELSDSSLAVTGDVIAREARPKQSPADKTASSAESSDVNSELSDSSLAVTGVTRNFISYGRLLERKGFQEAIEAFSQVIQTYPDCTLTIFGEGPFRKNLETQIQHLGLSHSVFLPGKISNPMDLLVSNGKEHPTSDIGHPTSFHCFLFPSWYEGFSGALVEAMMAGIPIIASDIPMNLEAVTDSKTALIFKVGDSQDLFEKMTFALEHPEQMAAMGQEARREAEERFDIEKIAREYERVVRSLSPPRL